MKILKLVLSLLFVCIANAALATDAFVSNPSESSSGGTAVIVASGNTSDYYVLVNGSPAGSVSSPSLVQRTSQVLLTASPSQNSVCYAQCYLTLPDGASATVSYSVAAGAGSTLGNVYTTIDSSTFNAAPGTTTQGSVSLGNGMHFLKVYGYDATGNSVVQITVNIRYP